jgi:signal recognition particle GTPase
MVGLTKKGRIKMKTNATKRAKVVERNSRRTLEQISQQVKMAFTSKKVSDDVKECLKTIIWEASNEADLPLGEIFDNDFSRVRATLPKIIEKLGEGCGRGYVHSIRAIIQYNTDAFQKFYEDKLDEDTEDLANQVSKVMKHPKIPRKLYNAMSDVLIENDIDADSPEWILGNLKKEQNNETNQSN